LLDVKLDSDEALMHAIDTLLDDQEREKLAWTRNSSSSSSGGGGSGEGGEEGGREGGWIRVDLEGRLMDAGAEELVPTHSGLYHNPEQVRTLPPSSLPSSLPPSLLRSKHWILNLSAFSPSLPPSPLSSATWLYTDPLV